MAHNTPVGGHSGILKVAERVKDTFWWPNMKGDIEKHVSGCETCRHASAKYQTPSPPLKPSVLPPNIGFRYHSDLFGPLTDKAGSLTFAQ